MKNQIFRDGWWILKSSLKAFKKEKIVEDVWLRSIAWRWGWWTGTVVNYASGMPSVSVILTPPTRLVINIFCEIPPMPHRCIDAVLLPKHSGIPNPECSYRPSNHFHISAALVHYKYFLFPPRAIRLLNSPAQSTIAYPAFFPHNGMLSFKNVTNLEKFGWKR